MLFPSENTNESLFAWGELKLLKKEFPNAA
jgi:hypothetical protein